MLAERALVGTTPQELESHIEPFKGLLLGLFFMGVGMNLDLPLLVARPLIVIGLVLGVLALQVSVMWAVGRAFRYSERASLLLAALLASGGEFAFVVFASAERSHLLPAFRPMQPQHLPRSVIRSSKWWIVRTSNEFWMNNAWA